MADTEDHLTAEERKFMDSRGESEIPAADAGSDPSKEGKEPATPSEEKTSSSEGETSEKRAEGGEAEEGKRVEGTVDRHAFNEERKRRREAEEGRRQAELLAVRMEERFKAYVTPEGELRRQPAQRQQPAAPPRPQDDIFGAVDHTMKTVEGMSRKITEYEQNERAKVAAAERVQWAQAHEAAFVKENPDYYDALKHLQASRLRELGAYGLQPAQAAAQLNAEEHQLMIRAAQLRVSPAAMAYNLSKLRGYQRKAQAPAGGLGGEDPNKQLDRIEQGKRAGGSMAGVGGKTSGGSGDVTLADLVKMSDAEFVAFKTKNPAKYRRLKGAEH